MARMESRTTSGRRLRASWGPGTPKAAQGSLVPRLERGSPGWWHPAVVGDWAYANEKESW